MRNFFHLSYVLFFTYCVPRNIYRAPSKAKIRSRRFVSNAELYAGIRNGRSNLKRFIAKSNFALWIA